MRHAFECTVALLLATTVAPAAAQPAAASGEAVLRIFVNGRDAGSQRSTVAMSDAGITITGTGNLLAPVALTLDRFEMRYDRGWKPLELNINGTLRGQPLSVRTKFNGTTAISEVVQAGQRTSKEDPVSADAIVLPNSFYAAYEALAARLAGASAGSDLPVYVAPQAEIRLRIIEVTTENIQLPQRTIAARHYRLSFANPGGNLDAELWADQANRLVRFTIPAAAVQVVREDAASVAAREQTVTRAGDEQIMIAAAGFNLAATISHPPAAAGDRPAGTPGTSRPVKLPAVILVPGSGPVDRDSIVQGIPIFGQIAGALADAGFVVVRYDKRGIGQSGGRTEAAALSDYAEDIRSIVRYVSKRKDVDDRRIAVFGHSEGAWVALLAAAKEKRIAAVVLASGAAGTGADLILEQQRHALERMELTDADKQAKIDLQKKIHQAVIAGGGWEGVPDELRRQADTPWFRSFLSFVPAQAIAVVRQPILVVHGTLDRQAPGQHADQLADLARGRKKSGQTDLVKVEGINHLLVPATTGEVDEYASLKGRNVSGELIAAVTTWLSKVMGKHP